MEFFEKFVCDNVNRRFDLKKLKWTLPQLEQTISDFDKRTIQNPSIPIIYVKDGFFHIEEKTKPFKK